MESQNQLKKPEDTLRLPIDGSTQCMGLIGEGLSHTLSPAMHNRAAQILGINAAYLPFSMKKELVEPFLTMAWELNTVGFNVTTPHKLQVARLFPECGLGSVNTLYRGAAGWCAVSTDGEGFARGLKRIERELAAFKTVVILGSGGAACALVEYFALSGHSTSLMILRRSDKADESLSLCGGSGLRPACLSLDLETLTSVLSGRGEDTLLIQATNAPLRGDDLAALTPALKDFGGVVVDLVYGKPSALYFAALAKDLVAQDGEAMLIEQARLAQKLWWGQAASFATMAAVLRGK